jgi:deoxycytidylate deaminase
MSYNADPKWAEIILPEMPCPTCGRVLTNFGEGIADIIMHSSYYEARHIPPELTLACDNPECADCDEDFTYTLSVAITTTRKQC